jgi:predicted aspartyl protease
MGKVFIAFTVTNSADLDAVEEGRLEPGDVRSVAVEGAVMDTGATHLCLPASIVARLGLALLRTVPVETATGTTDLRFYRNALVTYEDRISQEECIELPDGVQTLLGVFPMEALGIEPDVRTHTVRKLPLNPAQSYITVLGARLP